MLATDLAPAISPPRASCIMNRTVWLSNRFSRARLLSAVARSYAFPQALPRPNALPEPEPLLFPWNTVSVIFVGTSEVSTCCTVDMQIMYVAFVEAAEVSTHGA